jgi:hypothetical protein
MAQRKAIEAPVFRIIEFGHPVRKGVAVFGQGLINSRTPKRLF